MRHIHPDFKTTKILGFITDLITDARCHSINDLTEHQLQQFSSLLIEAAGHDGETEFLTQHAFSDVLILKIREALFNDSKDCDETLIHYMKSHAVEYYNDTMQAIFDSVYEDYEQNQLEWAAHVKQYGNPDDRREAA